MEVLGGTRTWVTEDPVVSGEGTRRFTLAFVPYNLQRVRSPAFCRQDGATWANGVTGYDATVDGISNVDGVTRWARKTEDVVLTSSECLEVVLGCLFKK